MARSFVITATALLTVASLIVLLVDTKHWPDLSCHPANESGLQKTALDYHRMSWVSCNESYEKYKGNCAGVCMLLKDQIVSVEDLQGPVLFNSTRFVNYFGKELGSGSAQEEILTKIKAELDVCQKNHPEIKKLLKVRKTPCEPWNNFLNCIDDSLGCGRMIRVALKSNQ